MKQTAVEWLVETLNNKIDYIPIKHWDYLREIIQQAKLMEKEQIIRARQDGLDNGFSNGSWDSNLYYNETFKSE